MEKEVKVTNRKYRMRSYERCFVGSEAAEWLQQSGGAETVEKAVCMGHQLIKAGLIRHVLDENDFENDYLFYRFKADHDQIMSGRSANAGRSPCGRRSPASWQPRRASWRRSAPSRQAARAPGSPWRSARR
mmetsp:Transcript_21510/g.47188  ORF Transcript_21510/g.47188 Transcript_21510/m.47188 type:complete len:131 (+) Transcript_21510:635-1027(+)